MTLRNFYKANMPPLLDALDRFDFAEKRAYADMAAQTFYYVSHSSRLLALSAAFMPSDDERMHARFLEHAQEEKGHQLLALHDLKALDQDIKDYPVLPSTRAFYESQYTKITNDTPYAFFGYILVLEGMAVERGSKIYEAAIQAFGKKACTFLKVHAADDVSHLDKALTVLEGVPPPIADSIQENFRQSAYLYECMLTQMSDRARQPLR